jgi:aminopeptidase YwaD
MPISSRRRLALLAGLLAGALPAVAARADDPAPAPPATSAATSPPRPTTNPEVTADDVRERVKWLACEAHCGRESLEPGAAAASAWVADEFARLKLEPKGEDGGWFQPIEIPRLLLSPGNVLEVSSPAGKTSFQVEKDWNPFSFSPGVEATGDVVFAGYGIVDAERGYDDWAGIDAKGKVVLVLRHDPRWLPGKNRWTEGAQFTHKYARAVEKGAAALLIVNDPHETPDGDPLVPWADGGGLQRPGAGKIPFAFVTKKVAAAVLAPLGRDLVALQRAIDEAPGKPTPQSAAVPGVTVRLKTALAQVPEKGARNVAGLLRGADPAVADEVIVVGAHHDHVGRGLYGANSAESGRIHPGADDNASGTAALLELAEAFASDAKRPRRSLLFLSFTGEERGLLGSQWWVDHPTVPLGNVVAMVNCDMVGRYDPKRGLEVGGVGTARGLQELVAAEDARGIALKWDPQGTGPSDNVSFFLKKIPVLFFFTGIHPDYHTPRDTWDKIDAASEAKIVLLVRDVVRTLADRGDRVAYTDPPKREGSRAALGVRPVPTETEAGVAVEVGAGGAAEAAGMKDGDVVIGIGKSGVKSMRDLSRALAGQKPGDEVMVKVLRDGKEVALKVTLGSR